MTVEEFIKNTTINDIYKIMVDDGTKTVFEYDCNDDMEEHIPCGDSVIKSIKIVPFIVYDKTHTSLFVTLNIDPKETSDMPNLDHQKFIDLIGKSTYDLLKAAGMMNKANSAGDFVEFLYKNGYKIVKDDKEK